MKPTTPNQIGQALRDSENWLHLALEAAQMGVWEWRPQTGEEIWSPETEALMGWAAGSFDRQYTSFLNSVHPDDRRLVQQIENQGLQSGNYEMEFRIVRADTKQIRWLASKGRVFRDEAGQPVRVVGVTYDVTDRKQAESASQLMQDMTQAVFQSADFHSALAIALEKVCEATQWDFGEAWVPSSDRSVLVCSPAWYSKSDRLTEFRNQSTSFTFALGVGLPGNIWQSHCPEWHYDVSSTTDANYLRTQLALEAGLKSALGVPIVANDEVITVLVFYMFIAREEDQRLIDLISASTELGLFIQRKQAEEDIRKSLQREQELNELKSHFITTISHEFRTPLTTILSSAELLEHYQHRLSPEKQRVYLQRIQTNSRHMADMLNDVLIIGNAESGKLELQPSQTHLATFCQELVEELQLSVGGNHHLVFSVQTCDDGYVDQRLLRHILTNLLTNAFKYSPAGSMVKFSLSCEQTQMVFTIQDEGIGIPLESQPFLFEPFCRASNVKHIQGTGLGLSVVKQCVDLHGGQIEVVSDGTSGSTFIVTLPLNQPIVTLPLNQPLDSDIKSKEKP